MRPEERQQLAARIEAEIERLREDISGLADDAESTVAPDVSLGRLTRLEALGAKGVSEAALAKARQRLAGLERALQRIDQEDFGECCECGETIPIARLLLLPESRRCVACAE